MIRLVGITALLAMACGCSGDAAGSVSGSVTLDGQPLAKGLITFSGEGKAAGTGGSSIAAGKYTVKGLPPGKYHVQIAGEPENKFIEPNSPEAQRTLTDEEIRAMSDPLPAGTMGTTQTLQVNAGEQTHDFALKSPASR
ncbi:MAG: carboxypeptidase-like regulatory domain-containing protein [Planctomycetaceae bacterium]|nr:carboxypeptidase-like regulatory domain-containing protein [Planctomycetaceae bacterium]